MIRIVLLVGLARLTPSQRDWEVTVRAASHGESAAGRAEAFAALSASTKRAARTAATTAAMTTGRTVVTDALFIRNPLPAGLTALAD